MSDFNLGTIRVVDNGDGVYRYPIRGAKTVQDKITDDQGKVLKPYDPKVRATLKQLGIHSLQGLKLNPASLYLTQLQSAEREALTGNTRGVQDAIRLARQAAADAKLTFAEKRAETALTQSLKVELGNLVKRAHILANLGEVVALGDVFNGGRDILSRLRVPLDQAAAQQLPLTPELIAKLEKQAMVQALPLLWKKVRSFSDAGNVERTLENIRYLKEYSQRGQTPLNGVQRKLLAEYLRKAYGNSIDLHFREAGKKAMAGDVPGTRLYLNRAIDAARYAGEAWDRRHRDRCRKLIEKALFFSPVFLFAEAERASKAGDVDQVRRSVQQARDYRKVLGKPLPTNYEKLAKLLREQALLLSVDVLLGKAAQQVTTVEKKGDMTRLHAYIAEARKNARLAKITLSAAQKTSIRLILDKAFAAAIAWRFRSAEHSADLGKVDDTFVPLNEARTLAKRGGLSFDEAKAKTLVDRALTLGIDLHFKAAESFAQTKDSDNVYLHLATVRDYYRRLGKAYDVKRGKAILKILNSPGP